MSIKRMIIDCQAPTAELRRRIVARENDASEATLEVLQRRLQTRQPISRQERESAVVVSVDSAGLDNAKIEDIREMLG